MFLPRISSLCLSFSIELLDLQDQHCGIDFKDSASQPKDKQMTRNQYFTLKLYFLITELYSKGFLSKFDSILSAFGKKVTTLIFRSLP